MAKLRLSLRVHIILLFVVSVLTVTVVSTAIGVGRAKEEVRSGVEDRQREDGVRAAEALQSFLGASERSLNVTALLAPRGHFVPNLDRAAVGALLDPLLGSSEDFEAAFVVDAEGTVVVARPDIPRWSTMPVAAHPAFRSVRASGRASLEIDPTKGPPAWAMIIASTAREPSPYYLFAVLSLSRIEDLLYLHLEPNTDALVVDQHATVVAATIQVAPMQSVRSWSGYAKASVDGAIEAPALDGGGLEVLVTLSRIPGGRATILFMSPTSQIAALQGQIVRAAALTGGALALTAIVLGAVAGSSITRPVSEVRNATHRMRQGDLTVRAKPQGPRELHDLAEDFNSMAATLASEWEQRVRLQNRLEELVDQRTAELQIKREEMELFFYGVGHDIKSPVISIANISQMMEEALREKSPNRAKLRDLQGRIGRSSATLRTLIMELLAFAQIERTKPKPRPTRLRDVVNRIVEELEPQARRRGVRLEASGRALRYTSDPDRLSHVLTNLVDNAIKYMPEGRRGARARITWTVHDGTLVIRVADNGAGIPKHVQPQLFKPFSRYLSKTTDAAGAGLGLSIVKRLTESLNGTVTLESEEGRGATFVLTFPTSWRDSAS